MLPATCTATQAATSALMYSKLFVILFDALGYKSAAVSCAILKSIKAFDSSFNHSLLALICAQALGYRLPLNGIPGVNL